MQQNTTIHQNEDLLKKKKKKLEYFKTLYDSIGLNNFLTIFNRHPTH